MYFPCPYIDWITQKIYCCAHRHICFSDGETQEMADRICSNRIWYQKTIAANKIYQRRNR